MRVTPPRAWCFPCLTISLTFILAIQACDKKTEAPAVAASPGDTLPECPKSGDYTREFQRKEYRIASAATGQLSIAGARTNIPEFHDCQKLIDSTGRTYLTRIAIFSADDLKRKAARIDTIRNSLIQSKGETRAMNVPESTFVVGEIFAPDGGYPPLGIQQHFSCLFLYPTTTPPTYLEAKVVPVGTNEVSCKSIPHTATGKTLEVHRTDFGDVKRVPDVARWDWDSVHHKQYIGVGCHRAWCEIGESLFVSSSAHANPPVPPSPAQMAVKGWYDEQTLGFPYAATPGATPTDVKVGTVRGTLVPMSDLGDQDGTPGKNFEKFKPVATVALDGGSTVYFDKLNLAPSLITNMVDTVSLCRGTWPKCALADSIYKPHCSADAASDWWVKVVSPKPGGGTPPISKAYFCVTRREHKGYPMPGVVRWRWAIKDETMWIYCVQGCCEVEADSKELAM